VAGASDCSVFIRSDLAAMLRAFFDDHEYDGPFRKRNGASTLIHPLWTLSKKEITTYLEALTPHHNTQGSPTEFDRGAPSRDIFYLLADTIQALWPGAPGHLFLNHRESSDRAAKNMSFARCSYCSADIDVSTADPMPKGDICDSCTLLEQLNLLLL